MLSEEISEKPKRLVPKCIKFINPALTLNIHCSKYLTERQLVV